MSQETPDFVVADETILTDASLIAIRPNWNVDGRSLVFESRDKTGSRLHQLVVGRAQSHPLEPCNDDTKRVQGRPAFFDVDDFAYVGDRHGGLAIWRCELRHEQVTQLTFPPDGAADFGPATTIGNDGHFLFFRKPQGDGGPRVHLGRLGSRDVEVLTTAVSNQPWRLHKTNAMVFHSDANGAHRVCLQPMRADATTTAIGSDDEKTAYVTPYPSPDDRHVAFASMIDGAPQIFVMRMDGTHRQRITAGAGSAMFPCWSPDGTRIAYIRGNPTTDDGTGLLATTAVTPRS